MTVTITKSVSTLVLALMVFLNTLGNSFGVGDVIETEPPTTTSPVTTTETADPEWSSFCLDYDYNREGDYYYVDDKECWRSDTNPYDVLDSMSLATAMFIDQVRVRFNYEGKDWLIQMWKGQYGFLLVGSEIGVFTAPEGAYDGVSNDITQYRCPAQEDWLNIQHEAYYKRKDACCHEKIFTREYGKYWWTNGFVKGQISNYATPKTEITTASRITFKSEEMADLFVKGLDAAGFKKASTIFCLGNDTYYQKGADVIIRWVTVHQDINIGNGEGEPVIIQYN